jgi:hypothetical protein
MEVISMKQKKKKKQGEANGAIYFPHSLSHGCGF